MNEDKTLIYEYPSAELKAEICATFEARSKLSKKLKFIGAGCLIGAMLLFMSYCLIVRFKFVFFFLTALCIAAAVVILKTAVRYNWHYLFVKAFDTDMDIEYFSNGTKSNFTIKYDNILSIRFFDKNYSSIKIKYIDSHSDTVCNIFLLLNAGTPEQGFFLYTMPQLTEKLRISERSIEKKFGSEEEFYSNFFE